MLRINHPRLVDNRDVLVGKFDNFEHDKVNWKKSASAKQNIVVKSQSKNINKQQALY